MKLTIKERFSIIQLCPQKADILTQTIVREIIKKVELSQAEVEKINLRPRADNQPGFQWDNVSGVKNVTFSGIELGVLRNEIEKLDKEKNITQDLLTICLKIKDEKIEDKKGE